MYQDSTMLRIFPQLSIYHVLGPVPAGLWPGFLQLTKHATFVSLWYVKEGGHG